MHTDHISSYFGVNIEISFTVMVNLNVFSSKVRGGGGEKIKIKYWELLLAWKGKATLS